MVSQEWLVLSHLRANARMTLTELSRRTCIPISTLYGLLRRFERSTIVRHTSLLDFETMGFHCHAAVLLKVPVHSRDALLTALAKMPAVNTVYRVNNGFDVLAEVVCRTVKELESSLAALEGRFGVEQIQVYHVLDQVSKETFLGDPLRADLLPVLTHG